MDHILRNVVLSSTILIRVFPHFSKLEIKIIVNFRCRLLMMLFVNSQEVNSAPVSANGDSSCVICSNFNRLDKGVCARAAEDCGECQPKHTETEPKGKYCILKGKVCLILYKYHITMLPCSSSKLTLWLMKKF